jgi:hypothetical protein
MIVSDTTAEKILDLIYDAAAEPELWRTVLTKISDATGSRGGIIFGLTPSQLQFDYNAGLSEDSKRAYQERHLINPWSEVMVHRPVGQVVLSDSILPLQALRRTLFFDEVHRPQDVAHNTMMPLAKKDGLQVAFNICRSARQGPIDEAGIRLIEHFAPHMVRSMHLAFRFHGYGALQRLEYRVLDRLAMGVVLLDAKKRVLYANGAARAHGREGGPLRLRNAGLAALSQPHAQRLSELIRAALVGAPAGTMSLPRPADAIC